MSKTVLWLMLILNAVLLIVNGVNLVRVRRTAQRQAETEEYIHIWENFRGVKIPKEGR